MEDPTQEYEAATQELIDAESRLAHLEEQRRIYDGWLPAAKQRVVDAVARKVAAMAELAARAKDRE